MKIEVTQNDINKSTYHCDPIFIAIRRNTDRLIAVFPANVSFITKHGYRYIDLPKKAQKFLKDFDNNIKVKPISFYLRYTI